MRESLDPVEPGKEVGSSTTWRADAAIPHGARVEATDGVLGVVRDRFAGASADDSELCVDTDSGVLYVPERLTRETRGQTVVLSLPLADVRAQSSDHPGGGHLRSAPRAT